MITLNGKSFVLCDGCGAPIYTEDYGYYSVPEMQEYYHIPCAWGTGYDDVYFHIPGEKAMKVELHSHTEPLCDIRDDEHCACCEHSATGECCR